MKKIARIKIKEGSSFMKMIEESINIDPEKIAAEAAERARKEATERLNKRKAEQKAYLESIRHYDELVFINEPLREKILKLESRIATLNKQLSAENKKKEETRKQLQAKCLHDMVLERRTTYKDDYDNWHDGNYERKCLEFVVTEE